MTPSPSVGDEKMPPPSQVNEPSPVKKMKKMKKVPKKKTGALLSDTLFAEIAELKAMMAEKEAKVVAEKERTEAEARIMAKKKRLEAEKDTLLASEIAELKVMMANLMKQSMVHHHSEDATIPNLVTEAEATEPTEAAALATQEEAKEVFIVATREQLEADEVATVAEKELAEKELAEIVADRERTDMDEKSGGNDDEGQGEEEEEE